MNKNNEIMKEGGCCSGNDSNITKESGEQRDRRLRVEKIQEIVTGINYASEEEKSAAVLSFARANLTYQEISKIAETLKAGYRTDFNKSKGVY